MARRSPQNKNQRPLAVILVADGPPVFGSAFGKNLVNFLFPAYVLMIAVGYGVFLSGLATTRGNEIGSDRCLFHAINAASLTGFPATIGVHEFNALGQAVSLLLMIGGTLFTLVVGGLATVRILRLRFSDGSVILSAVMTLCIAGLIGTAAGMAGGMGLFDALFLAVSSFSNAGLTANISPGLNDGNTHLLLLPLAIVGGLGVTVWMELAGGLRSRATLSTHSRTTLAYLAAAYVIGFVLLLTIGKLTGDVSFIGTREAVIHASAQSINARSLGLPLVYATGLSRSVQWLLIGLMSLGGGSAGTAGGLKVTTIAELIRGTRRALRGERTGRSFGIAIAWVAIYLGMIAITLLILLKQLTGMPADRVLFLAASAIGNVGLCHDPLSITYDGLYTLSAAMFAGRVVPLLVLWWMADTTTDAELAIG